MLFSNIEGINCQEEEEEELFYICENSVLSKRECNKELEKWWDELNNSINLINFNDLGSINISNDDLFKCLYHRQKSIIFIDKNVIYKFKCEFKDFYGVIFYSYQEDENLCYILGFMIVSEYLRSNTIRLKDLHLSINQNIINKHNNYLEENRNKYNKKNYIFINRLKMNLNEYCSFYDDINIIIDKSNIKDYEFRINLIFKVNKLIGEKNEFKISNITNNNNSNISLNSDNEIIQNKKEIIFKMFDKIFEKREIYTENGRYIDNSSYHVCKLLTLYEDSIKEKIINFEKYYCEYKLLKYYPFERDILNLCNTINLNIEYDYIDIDNNIGNIDFGKLLSNFRRIYPEKGAPSLLFYVPFSKYYYSSKENNLLDKDHLKNLVFINNGIVYFTYLDFKNFLFGLIKNDIHNTKTTHIRNKVIKCYNNCKKNKIMNNINKIKEQYYTENSTPLSIDSEDSKLFNDCIAIPLCNVIHNNKEIEKKNNLNKRRKLNNNNNNHFNSNNYEELSYDDNFIEELLFPPCIKKLILKCVDRHLYYQERMTLLFFLFSIGWNYDKVLEYWKKLCDICNIKDSKNQNITQFKNTNEFGKMVKDVNNSINNYKNTNTNQKYFWNSCSKLINSPINKDGKSINICPFVNDIEDSHLNLENSCKSKCKNELIIGTNNILKNIYEIENPYGYHSQFKYAYILNKKNNYK
jgi:hypothetical protein